MCHLSFFEIKMGVISHCFEPPNRNQKLSGGVHPKLPRKIIGKTSFPFQGPGIKLCLEPKFQNLEGFFHLGAMFESPEQGPKISKLSF